MTAYAQRSFAGGELAPSLYARTDQQKYAIGLRACRNFMVQRHGGIANRPGLEFRLEVKDSLQAVRLIKFERSRDEAYVLEFGNLYVRMIRNGSYVSVAGIASGWVFPFFYSKGDSVVSVGIYYVNISGTNPNNPPASEPTVWYPLTGTIYELPTPYLVADLPEIRYAQRSGIPYGGTALDKATILIITHPSYAPRELDARAETIWQLSTLSFAPAIGPPVGPLVLGGGSAGAIRYWSVTAISDSGEESLVLTNDATNAVPSAGTPTTLAWNAPAVGYPAVALYKIYRSEDGASFGLIGTSPGLTFSDVGNIADLFAAPPGARVLFNSANNYPTAVTHYQQRLMLAGTNTDQEKIWGSRTAQFTNFSTSFPLQDDDAVTFAMVGTQLNAIQHLLDLGRLIAFTSNEEKIVEGDDAGILRPDAINPRKLSRNGSSTLRPIEIDDSAVYVQGRGTIVRDLKPISADAYQGTDLTVFAAHLFNGYELAAWDYAESPNSIVWAARSDGKFVGLTYLREHDIFGWHRHDTDGIVEDVCVAPEGDEDRVYFVVRRVINGVTKRYIERMKSRYYADPEDAFFVDCGSTYDGWNAGATTMTLSGGVAWDETETQTLTASVASFVAGDVGNVIILVLEDASGNETDRVRLSIEGYTGTTIVTVRPDKTVVAGLRSVAKTTWAKAIHTVTGLSRLEGKAVSVLGDGYVVASPNNTSGPDGELAYPEVIVTAGVAELGAGADKCFAVIHVGLPYVSDMEPLDLDLPGGATIKDKKIMVSEVGLYMERSRGVWIGDPDGPTDADPLEGLREWKARTDEDYANPVAERTDFYKVKIRNEWGPGRFLVRQVDPLPLTILSATPIGYLPT